MSINKVNRCNRSFCGYFFLTYAIMYRYILKYFNLSPPLFNSLPSFHMTLEGCPHWPQLPIFYSFLTSPYFQATKDDSKYSEEEFIKISFGKTRNPGWLKLHLQKKCLNWGHRTGLMSQQFPLLQLLLLAFTEHHRELPYPQNDNFGAGGSERQLYNHCSSKSQNLCCHPPIKNNKGFYK